MQGCGLGHSCLEHPPRGSAHLSDLAADTNLSLRMQAVGPSVNQVITLTSATGFHVNAKRPPVGPPAASSFS